MVAPTQSPHFRRCLLSAELIDACLDSGFDPLFSDELLLDHATFLPLHFLNPNMALPVVPVIINALTPPMPTAKRCFAFGEFLGTVLQRSEKRIALIATGGLSHWPGEAQHGRINIPFDKKFLDNLVTGDHHQLTAYTPRRDQQRSRLRRPRNQNLDRPSRSGAELEGGTGGL